MRWPIRRTIMLAVGIALIGLVTFIINGSSEAHRFDYDQQPSLGKASAPVEIVAFGDYTCSECKAFNQNFYSQIQKELIATGKATFYYVHHPVSGDDSRRASRFSEAVYQILGNDVFWQFHHVLYDKLDSGRKHYTDEFLKHTLNGLVSEEETEEVVKAYQDGSGENAVEEDLRVAEEMKVTEAPALFVDGKRFEGESMAELKEMVKGSTH